MAVSILNRITGQAMAVGTILFTWWLMSLAAGADSFANVQALMNSWLGVLILIGFTAALFFHAASGIRHIVWDAGYGFGKETAKQSGAFVLGATAFLTVVFWLLSLAAA
jgi:succinate dehydrogenase / fumarate reductase cytochrome b subunit